MCGYWIVCTSVLNVNLYVVLCRFLLKSLGVDGRLGGGFLVFLSIFALAYSSRNYFDSVDDIKKCVWALLLGMGLNNVFSILSFFGINVWVLFHFISTYINLVTCFKVCKGTYLIQFCEYFIVNGNAPLKFL
jgi:hypothetical protein